MQLFGDSITGFSVHRFVKLAALYNRVYYYKFSYVGRYSHTYFPADKPYGKCCMCMQVVMDLNQVVPFKLTSLHFIYKPHH